MKGFFLDEVRLLSNRRVYQTRKRDNALHLLLVSEDVTIFFCRLQTAYHLLVAGVTIFQGD